jgi:hypothetical protein
MDQMLQNIFLFNASMILVGTTYIALVSIYVDLTYERELKRAQDKAALETAEIYRTLGL